MTREELLDLAGALQRIATTYRLRAGVAASNGAENVARLLLGNALNLTCAAAVLAKIARGDLEDVAP